jgi:hypothetical protein
LLKNKKTAIFSFFGILVITGMLSFLPFNTERDANFPIDKPIIPSMNEVAVGTEPSPMLEDPKTEAFIEQQTPVKALERNEVSLKEEVILEEEVKVQGAFSSIILDPVEFKKFNLLETSNFQTLVKPFEAREHTPTTSLKKSFADHSVKNRKHQRESSLYCKPS